MIIASSMIQDIAFGEMPLNADGSTGQVRHIIFDLSEVFIHGLSGFEGPFAQELGIRADTSFDIFGGIALQELLRGNTTEEQYLTALIEKNAWDPAQANEIQQLIRENFHHCIPGTLEIALELSMKYPLVLLSDHAREWAAYILEVHPFIRQIFTRVYFSYQYGKIKRDRELFDVVLHDLTTKPEHCLFIDDSARNIDVALSVGLRAIRFQHANKLREALTDLGLLRRAANDDGGCQPAGTDQTTAAE